MVFNIVLICLFGMGEKMTKSFDIDKYNSRECQVHNHGFSLGEQSKQAEIDELQKRIDEAVELMTMLNDDNTVRFMKKPMLKILKGNTDDH